MRDSQINPDRRLGHWLPTYGRAATMLGNAGLSLADQGIVSVVNFLTVVLLARVLDLQSFGVFMLAQTVLVLLTGVQNALVAQPHNILGAQRAGRDYVRLTSVLGLLQFALSLVLAAIAAGCGVMWLLSGSSEYASAAFALALAIPAWMGQEFVRRVLYTQNEIGAAAVNNFISYGLQLIGIALIASGWRHIEANPANALLALGASSLIAAVFGGVKLSQHLRQPSARIDRWRFRDFWKTTVETWRLSRWLVAQQCVSWFGASGHGFLLTALLGPATFGVYRAAYQVVNILNPLRQAAMNHLPSKAARAFASQGSNGLARWSTNVSILLSIPFVVAALVIVVAAEPLAALMYGSELRLPGLQAFVALGALGFVLNFARAPIDYAVLVAGRGRALFLRTLWLNAFVLTCGLFLIQRFGITGALFSEIATAALAALLTVQLYWSLRGAPRVPTAPAGLDIDRASAIAERTAS